ncbi:MAG: primosomal protein N' [SAR324 cluster bacterium]|nr:primosomal protein N' [SAR324 cluster bacterium]
MINAIITPVPMIVEVALNVPLKRCFDYIWPESLGMPAKGIRVVVPFAGQTKSGVVVQLKETSQFHEKLRAVQALMDDFPLFGDAFLDLCQWAAEYYYCGFGEILNSAVPGGLNLKFDVIFTRIVDLAEFSNIPIAIYDFIEARPSWSLKEWQQHFPEKKEEKILGQLVADKKIHREFARIGHKISEKKQKYVRLRGPVLSNPGALRSTKKQAILELLQSHNELSVAELKDQVKDPLPVLKKLSEEGLVEITEKRVFRNFMAASPADGKEDFKSLSNEQQQVFSQIRSAMDQGCYQTFLLQGVTGSGKTEVYMHAVQHNLSLGKSSLILVPEIALTPQLVNRFRSRFGQEIGLLHSGMDDGERFDEWSKIQQQKSPIVIGARSAVFAPLENIGLVIVDEEHDSSYKQEESPRYNARDLAIFRGYKSGATVILGSATPSLESCYNVMNQKYKKVVLTSRIQNAMLPEVTLLDLKSTPRQKGSYFFTVKLVEALRSRLLRQEQSILFLNRRGYANIVKCQICENVMVCRNCSISLVYHQMLNQLKCHQCDYQEPFPSQCVCGAHGTLKVLGIGTEQVETEIHKMFPQARVLRLDRDTLHGKHALSEKLRQIQDHEVDIIIGTQLIAKGHDFPQITLVGVVWADISLNIPDFRASERTFQLLTQVAGRSGRANKPGEVIIQTYSLHHHSLQFAKNHDFDGFLQTEFNYRTKLNWPPLMHMACLTFSSTHELQAEALAREFTRRIERLQLSICQTMGPSEAPIKKIKNRYRWVLVLKASHTKILHKVLDQALSQPFPLKNNDRMSIDIDPYNLL